MMKLNNIFKWLTLTAVAWFSVEAFAYTDDKEKEICRNPKVQEFTLPEYKAPDMKEVPPEAEFTFVVSGWANPKKFKLNGKGVDIPFTVQSSETFHKVKAKLPTALTGQAVRVNARIPAILGCYTTIGWLIKVADKAQAAPAPKPAETLPPAASTGAAPAIPTKAAVPPVSAPQAPKVEEKVLNIQDVQN
jgi:hypothetical protein